MENLPNTFIILDTEFTAWKGSMETNWKKEGEYQELVQISALKVTKTPNGLEVIDVFNQYSKPRINSQLSHYFTDLTCISQEKIDTEGRDFMEVLEDFFIFCEEYGLLIYSYGNDYEIIKLNIELYKILNIKYNYWEHLFLDICDVLRVYIDTTKYTSGTVYRAFPIKITEDDVHNAQWDVLSIYITLDYLLHHN